MVINRCPKKDHKYLIPAEIKRINGLKWFSTQKMRTTLVIAVKVNGMHKTLRSYKFEKYSL